ncbi:MAG: hypothetical protein EOO15_24735, partial [Chitinophagaceae bacterium]
MFLPKSLLELESLLPSALPKTVRRFLARRPQANAFAQFRAYPRALVIAQYREWKERGGDSLLLPVGRHAGSELLVHLGDESFWIVQESEVLRISDNFSQWLKTQRAVHKQANEKKL